MNEFLSSLLGSLIGTMIGFSLYKIVINVAEEKVKKDPTEINFISKGNVVIKKPRVLEIDEEKLARKEEDKNR